MQGPAKQERTLNLTYEEAYSRKMSNAIPYTGEENTQYGHCTFYIHYIYILENGQIMTVTNALQKPFHTMSDLSLMLKFC